MVTPLSRILLLSLSLSRSQRLCIKHTSIISSCNNCIQCSRSSSSTTNQNNSYLYSSSSSSRSQCSSSKTATTNDPSMPPSLLSPRPPSYLRPIPLPSTPLSPSLSSSSQSTTTTTDISTRLLHSLKSNTQIPRLPPLLTQDLAYKVSSTILHTRITQHNERPVGRKLGFTNRNIWAQYKVDQPNWNYVYDSTVLDISNDDVDGGGGSREGSNATAGSSNKADGTPIVDLSSLGNLEPRIEPELVLCLSHPPSPTPTSAKTPSESQSQSQSPISLLHCIEWIAPAFEIVISPWRNWVFSAAETTAAFALHGRLCIGRRVSVRDLVERFGGDEEAVLKCLREFRVELWRDGVRLDTGVGGNVLDGLGPVGALGWLCDKMKGASSDSGDGHLRLGDGEVVTTGTLTKALEMFQEEEREEVWEMKVEGLAGVKGVMCRFVC